MSLIVGIGDEILTALLALLVTTVITLVWKSTQVRDHYVQSTSSYPSSSQIRPAESGHQVEQPDTSSAVSPPTSEPAHAVEDAVNVDAEEDDDDEVDESADSALATIRVRFIDETLLEVRTPLTATLGLFKERNVSRFSDANRPGPHDKVKLIFNGKVLSDEAQTLSQLGLQDQCTLHCLIQRSANSQTASRTGADSSSSGSGESSSSATAEYFDLANICLPVLGSIIFVVWWFQIVHAQYFSMTSTFSLVFITFLYIASIVNTFYN